MYVAMHIHKGKVMYVAMHIHKGKVMYVAMHTHKGKVMYVVMHIHKGKVMYVAMHIVYTRVSTVTVPCLGQSSFLNRCVNTPGSKYLCLDQPQDTGISDSALSRTVLLPEPLCKHTWE